MWCKTCNKIIYDDICPTCGGIAQEDIPTEVYWCEDCNVPIIKEVSDIDKDVCPLCGATTKYMCADLRPVFPEERLLIEILLGSPLEWVNQSVWANNNRYYVNGKVKSISNSVFAHADIDKIVSQLEEFKGKNSYSYFNANIEVFCKANKTRYAYIKDEAFNFVKETVDKFDSEDIVISFSGGKDSTATADVVVRALGNPSLVHIFGNTTLEFPLTVEYAQRYRKNNPKSIFKIAKNKEQDFYSVCEDIGPPAQ